MHFILGGVIYFRTLACEQTNNNMAKITKKAKKEFVRDKLRNDPKWTLMALLKIYDFQTADEQQFEYTSDANNVGFTGADGEILTSFAKGLLKYRTLTERQMAITKNKMPKYWRQILNNTNHERLEAMMIAA